MKWKKIIQAIKANKNFLISTHVNPDPDALCSELALAMCLKRLGKGVTILNEETPPKRFHFLPGIKQIKVYDEKIRFSYDAAIILDCGDLDRIGQVKRVINPKKVLINIDHHLTNDLFGHLNFVKPQASSTAEVLYELFGQMKCPLTKNIALHLYAGIMTDTGSFCYENTSAHTHFIIGELMKFKFSPQEIYRKIYETVSLADLKEFTKVISCFDPLSNGKIICVELSKDVLLKFSDGFDLRDTIFKFLRVIQGVEVVVILTEVSINETRINMRSAGKVNVAQVAHFFKGGGHHNASGCKVFKNLKNTRREIIAKLGKVL